MIKELARCYEQGRAMFALEVLESYEWEEGSTGRMALAVIRNYITDETQPIEPSIPAEPSTPVDDEKEQAQRAVPAGRRAAANKPPKLEEVKKFEYLVKLAKQTNADTIPLVIKLAGRNGLGKAALERVMGLAANSICAHVRDPRPKVAKTFAQHFDWPDGGDK